MQHSKAIWLVACLATANATLAPPARADDTPTPPPGADAPAGVAAGPQLRVQSQAAEGPSAVTVRLQYTGEAAENAIGGLHNGATYMNNILAQLHVDTDKAFGWTGGSFVLESFYENADSLDTHYIGAVQDPSVIDTAGVAMIRIYQAYYKQEFGNTSLLFGIYDPETEFGITRPMDIFFNGAYAWTTTLDQSGINGPSTYPSTSLGFRARQKFNNQWSVQAAILDGVPDSAKYPNINAVNINQFNGAFMLAEADYTPSQTTKVMAGYWGYTGQFPALNRFNADGSPRQVYGSSGGYIGGATRLYSQTARRGLDGFANIGVAGGRSQQVDKSLNVGFVYTGLLDARPADRLGFAVGLAGASSAYRNAQITAGNAVENTETNFEITYRARITDWLTIQPDIQYWINPNMDPHLKNDLLFMVHFEISHVFGL